MNLAGPNTFWKVVLIILIVFFALRFFLRLFAPNIMRFILRKLGQRVEKQFRDNHHSQKQRNEEGKTTIDQKPSNRRKSSNNDVGEYIDYEEID